MGDGWGRNGAALLVVGEACECGGSVRRLKEGAMCYRWKYHEDCLSGAPVQRGAIKAK